MLFVFDPLADLSPQLSRFEKTAARAAMVLTLINKSDLLEEKDWAGAAPSLCT